MPSDTATTSSTVKPWAQVHGQAPGLVGVEGGIQLRIAGAPAGVLRMGEHGEVAIEPDGSADATAFIDREETLLQLLRGEAPPIVAILRGRLRAEGDGLLVLKVLFGLEAGSPWATPVEGSGHAV